MAIATVNPATGELVRRFDELSDREIDERLERAARAFTRWRRTPFRERAERMAALAARLEAEKDVWARTMVLEMGKTLASGVSEVEKCAWVCRHYAENAERDLADEEVASSAARSWVRYLPIGPVLAVMPWNFPFWQVFRFAAPALMAGNVGLLKHASNVPQCALGIEALFAAAGFPPGVFQTLLVGAGKVARIIGDPRVAAVTLTGSDAAGAQVASEAGREVKKAVLELGGSDPFLVMPSADLDAAVKAAVTARTLNNGQSCIAAKRFIVHRRVYPEFERRMAEALDALRVGDPMAPETQVGPLALAQVRDGVASQVERTVAAGARLLTRRRAIQGRGFYYPPAALAGIPEGSPAYSEEVFGPVALLFEVDGIDAAIALANDSRYGLGSSVWTRDEDEVRRFVDELEAGQTFVNAIVASDPRLPFGGVKRSGFGRELGRWGIREFVNAKTVYVAHEARHGTGGAE